MSSVISLLVIIQTMSVTASQESCHCSNGCSDFPNTACPTRSLGPVCKTPWFGSFCQMENIAFHKTATQSTTYNYLGHFHASYAVDGNTDTDFSHSSCSHTDEPVGGSASWQVLLGDHRVFNISRIRIYLRQDFLIHNKNMQVFVSGYLCNTASGTTLDGTRGPVTNPFDVTCRHVTKGNKVTIKMSGPYLTLCEVQVFVCSDGWFGSDCNKQCQCLDPSEVCDKETGYCRSGCAAGKQGPGCQQACRDGWFGNKCEKQCHCLDPSEVCDKDTGYCKSGCAAGKHGPGCQQVCSDGWFASDCNKQCQCLDPYEVCDKETGNCTSGCAAGKHGFGCQQVCSDGWFGSGCNKRCQCLDPSEVCDKETGNCTSGCAAGKHGFGCQQVCSDGRFAIGCNKRCQCLDPSEVCDKETGNCRSGCAAGKQGKGCQQDCDDGQYGVNCSYMCGQCSGSSDCQKVDGTCTQGCQHDFNPPLCKACVQGKYSVNCSATCGHCKDGPGCDRSTGHCERGCLPGYVSPLCVDECGDYTYGLNCLNQCEVCDKVTGECGTGYQTTPPPTTTLATGTEHSQDIRLIAACCVMALLFVYSAVTTTLVVRLKRGQALIKAELEKQYISLETPAESPIYDVIAGTHTYNNDVQSGDSDYENINTHGATSL
ncbi:multiple epidermal growth factor-like domains protein 6 isoform X1 [Haliotis rubra]|uniref:multiple epidermal growth factor-like domains protein 6 isoform X1 n=1 Tax=Haliotis rubra TaxID=36100 RepID=UPI001EE538D6|nr:multiple epidermal growth factor-like domains protein 6 isoform X1 [Haliotis rubra]